MVMQRVFCEAGPEFLNTTYPLINLAGRHAVQQCNITLKCNSERWNILTCICLMAGGLRVKTWRHSITRPSHSL